MQGLGIPPGGETGYCLHAVELCFPLASFLVLWAWESCGRWGVSNPEHTFILTTEPYQVTFRVLLCPRRPSLEGNGELGDQVV